MGHGGADGHAARQTQGGAGDGLHRLHLFQRCAVGCHDLLGCAQGGATGIGDAVVVVAACRDAGHLEGVDRTGRALDRHLHHRADETAHSEGHVHLQVAGFAAPATGGHSQAASLVARGGDCRGAHWDREFRHEAEKLPGRACRGGVD